MLPKPGALRHRSFFLALLLMGIGATASVPQAHAQNITDLYNTGVDASGNVLNDGDLDPHYTQNSGNADTPNSYVYSTGSYAVNPTSNYIAIDQAGGNGVYTETLQTTFTLPNDADLSTVLITGNWAVDNEGNDILINGISTGLATVDGFNSFTAFTLPTGSYKAGSNTLGFVFTNSGGPGGINVYFGTASYRLAGASAVPEPGSVALLAGMGVSGGAFLLRRKRLR